MHLKLPQYPHPIHSTLTKDIFERRVNTPATRAAPQPQDVSVGQPILAGKETIDKRVQSCADDRETNAPEDLLLKVVSILPGQGYHDDDLCVCSCV